MPFGTFKRSQKSEENPEYPKIPKIKTKIQKFQKFIRSYKFPTILRIPKLIQRIQRIQRKSPKSQKISKIPWIPKKSQESQNPKKSQFRYFPLVCTNLTLTPILTVRHSRNGPQQGVYFAFYIWLNTKFSSRVFQMIFRKISKYQFRKIQKISQISQNIRFRKI